MDSSLFEVNDVVQLNGNHKFMSCIGVISEVKLLEDNVRYRVDIIEPDYKIISLFVLKSDNVLEYIGKSKYNLKYEDDG